jgi:hypothetical protein
VGAARAEGKNTMTTDSVNLGNCANSIEARFLAELDAQPAAQFAELQELRDLSGKKTGYIRVYSAARLVKASFLSINVGPGRYFNVHIIPDPGYDVPRYVYEGMLMLTGSQISIDMFPDVDVAAEVHHLLELFGDAEQVYNEARQDPGLDFVPSRQLHMRAFSSPLFLLAMGVQEPQLPAMEGYAQRYFDAWLSLYRHQPAVSQDAAEQRAARRQHMARTLIEMDPDRDLVVQVYGEEMTQAIEAASML